MIPTPARGLTRLGYFTERGQISSNEDEQDEEIHGGEYGDGYYWDSRSKDSNANSVKMHNRTWASI